MTGKITASVLSRQENDIIDDLSASYNIEWQRYFIKELLNPFPGITERSGGKKHNLLLKRLEPHAFARSEELHSEMELLKAA